MHHFEKLNYFSSQIVVNEKYPAAAAQVRGFRDVILVGRQPFTNFICDSGRFGFFFSIDTATGSLFVREFTKNVPLQFSSVFQQKRLHTIDSKRRALPNKPPLIRNFIDVKTERWVCGVPAVLGSVVRCFFLLFHSN